MMELVNHLYAEESHISGAAMSQTLEILTFLLAPFAPYLAQELWEEQGKSGPGIQTGVARLRSGAGARNSDRDSGADQR